MTIHFHKASLRLSILYLAVIMAISLAFSINIYQLSVSEFDRGLRGGTVAFEGVPGGIITNVRNQIIDQREEQYGAAKQRIISRLVTVNLLILVGGGFLSYYLARRTLNPIEEAHAGLERFTADASHELRTPIAAMRAETEVALMNPKLKPEDAKQLLQSNLEELDKLTMLSEGLLRLAHTTNGNLVREKIPLDKLLADAVGRVSKVAEKKQILIHSKSTGKQTIIGEKSSLIEALVTVLDNAVKYSPENSEIKLSSKAESRFVRIEIADQGIGIKASELPYIFERFYRADSSRSKTKQSGYGLGLAIAKNIVEMHGGTITATSKPDEGSVFTIKLPLS